MDLGELLHATTRSEWAGWLQVNHDSAPEVWLVYHKVASGKPFVAYDDAVEEALCWGWIDSVIKAVPGTDSRAQRFTPRKPKSFVSELNKARIRKLEATGLMQDAGRAALPDYDGIIDPPPLVVPPDIEAALAAGGAWDAFCDFPEEYQRIRIGFVTLADNRPQERARRLANLVKQSAAGKMFGTLP